MDGPSFVSSCSCKYPIAVPDVTPVGVVPCDVSCCPDTNSSSAFRMSMFWYISAPSAGGCKYSGLPIGLYSINCPGSFVGSSSRQPRGAIKIGLPTRFLFSIICERHLLYSRCIGMSCSHRQVGMSLPGTLMCINGKNGSSRFVSSCSPKPMSSS